MPVLAISILIIEANKKAKLEVSKESKLQWILYIYDPAQFREFFIEALIDSGSKTNMI